MLSACGIGKARISTRRKDSSAHTSPKSMHRILYGFALAGLLVVYSQDVSATESAEEIAWEIHSALKKHDPDTAALVESAII
jgi:hypothetical protein